MHLNADAMNDLFSTLNKDEFNSVNINIFVTAHEMGDNVKEIYDGTSTIKESKLYILKKIYDTFVMLRHEDIDPMYTRFKNIVNELKGLG